MFSGIPITIISSVFYLFLCFLVVLLLIFCCDPSLLLSSWVGRRKGSFVLITSSLWGFPSPNFNLHVHLVLYLHTSFPSASISFIDNPVIITEPAVTCARLLSLGLKPYPSSEFQGVKTFCPSFCASLIAGSRRAFLCVDCVCLLLEFWVKCRRCERLLLVKHFYLTCLLFFRRLKITLDSEQPMLKEKQIIPSVWGGIKGFEHF